LVCNASDGVLFEWHSRAHLRPPQVRTKRYLIKRVLLHTRRFMP